MVATGLQAASQDLLQHAELGMAEPNEPKAWQRFYMGYKQRFQDDCIIHLANGSKVTVAQTPSARVNANTHAPTGRQGSKANSSSSGGGRGSKDSKSSRGSSGKGAAHALDKRSDPALTGTTVWDGAIVLAQYLTATPVLQGCSWPSGRQRPVVCELGAGTGAVSLSLLAAGAAEAAVITDIPDMLPHLRLNVARNEGVLGAGAAFVRALRWAQAAEDVAALGVEPYSPPFDVIVGSDLIYYSYSEATPHSRLLLNALHAVAVPHSHIYLALSLHHNPGEVAQFLRWAAEDGFTVDVIAPEQIPQEYRVWDVKVVRLRLSG